MLYVIVSICNSLPYNAEAARGLLGRTDKKHYLPFFGHPGGRLFL